MSVEESQRPDIGAAIDAIRAKGRDRAERLAAMAGANPTRVSSLSVDEFVILLFEVLADGLREGTDEAVIRGRWWEQVETIGLPRPIFDRSVFCLEVYASLLAFDLVFGPAAGPEVSRRFLHKAGGPFRLRRKLPGRERVRWEIERYREAAASEDEPNLHFHVGRYFARSCLDELTQPATESAVAALIDVAFEAFYAAAAGTVRASLATDVQL